MNPLIGFTIPSAQPEMYIHMNTLNGLDRLHLYVQPFPAHMQQSQSKQKFDREKELGNMGQSAAGRRDELSQYSICVWNFHLKDYKFCPLTMQLLYIFEEKHNKLNAH